MRRCIFEKIQINKIKLNGKNTTKNKHEYKVPANYFDDFENRIIQKNRLMSSKILPWISWKKITYRTIAMAASITLLFMLLKTKNMHLSIAISYQVTLSMEN